MQNLTTRLKIGLTMIKRHCRYFINKSIMIIITRINNHIMLRKTTRTNFKTVRIKGTKYFTLSHYAPILTVINWRI